MRKFIIDTSVFINFSRYNKINRLILAIIRNNLQVFTNGQLIMGIRKKIFQLPLRWKIYILI